LAAVEVKVADLCRVGDIEVLVALSFSQEDLEVVDSVEAAEVDLAAAALEVLAAVAAAAAEPVVIGK
jgi:hypothetical protein